MKPTACGLILFIYAYSLSFSAAASYGEACTDDSNCTDTGQVCTKNPADNTCTCYTDNNYKYDGSKCVKELGTDCSDTAACNNANVICDGSKKCKCNTLTHYDNNGETTPAGSCIAKHALGIDCTNPGIAVNSEQCLTGNAACIALSGTSMYTCQCKNGYYQVGTGCVQVTLGEWSNWGACSKTCGRGTRTRNRTCTPSGATECTPESNIEQDDCNIDLCERRIGDSCTDASQCTAQNSQCTGSGTKTCNCKSGYFTSSNSCLKRSLDETCSATSQCNVTNSECTGSGTRTCKCKSDYFRDGSSCLKRRIGESCSVTSQCTAQNSQCTGSGTQTCTCKAGYFTLSDSCLKRSLGDSCTDTSQCNVPKSECTGSGTKTCTCQSGYFRDGNSCLKRSLGDSCTDTSQCNVTNSECTGSGTKTCTCESGYFKDGNSCLMRYLGQSCNSNSGCQNTNSECRNSQCLCKSGYYQTGTGTSGKCTMRYLGQSCNSNSGCQNTNSECRNSQCLCKSGYYQTGTGTSGTCTRQALGEACTDSNQCSITSNAECSSGGNRLCQCRYGYYDTNGVGSSGSCKLRKNLGDACSTQVNNVNQCLDSSASCRFDNSVYKCKCNSGYHQKGTQCEANKALGETCNMAATEAECSDSSAQCLDSKCTCNTYSYDSNGLENSGACMPISNLQVTNVGFNSIQTNEITVTWSTPQNYRQYINSFNLTWKATNTESADLDFSKTSYTMTRGIASGRAYTVTIISINDKTQQGSQRTTSVVRYQAAKPAKTSGIDESKSDKDVSGGTITVVWFNAPGYKSGYIVKLKDGETVLLTKTVGSVSATFSSTGLKQGYNYTVTIQAKSEVYDNKTKLGDIFTTVFKTTPKLPGPPRDGVCNNPSDKSINLSWQEPANPNGYLVHYSINVLRHGESKYNVSTAGIERTKTAGNLEPGTFYTFRIYTVNEVGKSDTYLIVSTNCKTNAKMSEMPENLLITDVTSRSFNISWDKPLETFSSENYGYVLQIKDDENNCEEVIYKCSDCVGSFQVSNLKGLCFPQKGPDFYMKEEELASTLSYNASLNPDINYNVTVTAINDAGRGYPATKSQRTKEEAPQTPYGVNVVVLNATALYVTWKIDGPRPGKTDYFITLTAEDPATSKTFTITGFNVRNYTASGLQEYWNYNVLVTASTSIGINKSEETKQYRTLPAAPGKVSEFNIEDHPGGDYTKMKISWKMPTVLDRNGIISSYKFEHFESTMKTSTNKTFKQEAEGNTYTDTIDVTPEEMYNITVYAINEDGMEGEKHSEVKVAPPGVPINIEETDKISIIPTEKAKNIGETKVTVTLVQEFFQQAKFGQIRGTGLFVCSKKDCGPKSTVKTLDNFNSMKNWKEDKEAYRPTNDTWLEDTMKMNSAKSRRKREVTNLEYTVGSESCSDLSSGEYCNGPLQPGKSYYIFAVSCTNGGCLVSKPNGPFITKAVPDEDANLGLIIGIVVAGVVIIVLVVVILVLVMRRRKRKGDGMKPYSGDDDDDDFIKLDPNAAKILKKRPILLNDIDEYVINMHKDSNLLFSAEYEDLKTISPKHSCEAADKEENRMKNRYINIIPFDHSRVKLSTNGEDDSNDYINANYLPGYISPREYIGCQGPIPGTIDDFWRMTWEQNVSVIVMLTLCKEGQKIKCEQYWPDEVGEPKQYGDVIVEITSYSNIRTYDYRMFKITNGNTTRVIKHFHFLSWLDFQANVHHDIILDFIQQVRQHVQPPDTSGPMIIHCSAGVGRTGTYIALDHLMQYINEHDFDVKIDVFDLVLKLRENRQHMVQTEQQYVFIHDCVKEIMERKRQMENIYENQGFWNKFKAQDENIYQNEQSLYANVSTSKSEQNTEL